MIHEWKKRCRLRWDAFFEAGGETERLDAVLEIGTKTCVAGTGAHIKTCKAGTDSARRSPVEDVEALRGRLLSVCGE